MLEEELRGLVLKIQRFGCEFQDVEVKAANQGCPKRLFDTLSGFSNQDTGGIIVFGLDERKGFKAVGVYDPQDLQHQVAEQCKQMEPVVRPLFTVCEVNGQILVAAEIPGVDISERPVFYRGVGRVRGSYIRMGDADEPMSEYEIYSYDAFRKRTRDDIRTADGGKLTLFRQDLLDEYLYKVKKERENIAENTSDSEIMELMGITSDGCPTLSGVLLFSKYPQGYFPQLCITAVVVQGTEMGDVGDDGERFIANKRITGTIPQMLEDAVEFVRRNMRVKTIIDENGKRADKTEFPLKAVREVILNALVHRDYSIHTENIPIQIVMYSDRMEVISSGGLYGRMSIDSLGKVRAETRNPALANILEILGVTENRYSGIPTIRKEMKDLGLPAPVFEARRGEFIVTFKNNIPDRSLIVDQYSVREEGTGYMAGAARIQSQYPELVEFCRMPRSRAELIAFTGFSRFYTMDAIIKPMLESGILKMTMPEKPKSRYQRYFSTQS